MESITPIIQQTGLVQKPLFSDTSGVRMILVSSLLNTKSKPKIQPLEVATDLIHSCDFIVKTNAPTLSPRNATGWGHPKNLRPLDRIANPNDNSQQ